MDFFRMTFFRVPYTASYLPTSFLAVAVASCRNTNIVKIINVGKGCNSSVRLILYITVLRHFYHKKS